MRRSVYAFAWAWVLAATGLASASNLAEFNLLMEGNSLSMQQGIPRLIEDLSLLGIASGQSTPTVGVTRVPTVNGSYTADRIPALQDQGMGLLRKSARYDKPTPGQIDMVLHQDHWPGRIDSEAAPDPIAAAGYPETGYQSTADLYAVLADMGINAPMTIYATWGPRRLTPTSMRKVFLDRGMDWDDVVFEIEDHGFAAARFAEQAHGLNKGDISLIPVGEHWVYYDDGPGDHNDLYRPVTTDTIHQGDRGALLTAMLILSAAVDFDPQTIDTDSQAFADFIAAQPTTLEDWQAVVPYGKTSAVTAAAKAVPSPTAAWGVLALLAMGGIRRRNK